MRKAFLDILLSFTWVYQIKSSLKSSTNFWFQGTSCSKEKLNKLVTQTCIRSASENPSTCCFCRFNQTHPQNLEKYESKKEIDLFFEQLRLQIIGKLFAEFLLFLHQKVTWNDWTVKDWKLETSKSFSVFILRWKAIGWKWESTRINLSW